MKKSSGPDGITGSVQFSSVQSLSRVRLFATPWIAAHQASLSITNSWSSLKLTSIESVMPSSHLILCRPLFLLPPIPPSIRVFSNESTLRMRWPKYWSFSFSIIPSNEHPGLISFRMDWLDLQGTLKSLLQHHSSKASILWRSAFFTVQLSQNQGVCSWFLLEALMENLCSVPFPSLLVVAWHSLTWSLQFLSPLSHDALPVCFCVFTWPSYKDTSCWI